jgi:hypothetical protein
LGTVAVERGYYLCRRCGNGIFPFDENVGLTPKQLTPGAEKLVALAGLLSDSFEEAAEKVLPEMSGIQLSESTAQRTTEDAGARLGAHLDQGKTLGGPKFWDWHADAEGKKCAYVSIDATGVRQQAKGGGAAEGRMPYVSMVFNPVPDLPEDSPYAPSAKAEMNARYLAGLYSLEDLGTILRKQAGQVGMNRADRWIGLSDGGNGLEGFLRSNFPRVEAVIIDFWHVSDHLGDLARAWHPQDEEQAKTLKSAWCHVLKHEGGEKMIALLESLELPPRRPALRATYDEVLAFLRNHVSRMNYPSYVSKGWQIGSGAMESACKTVVGQRLKLAGMRWREAGTDNVCHLRALYKSERSQWHSFWHRQYGRLNVCSTN